MIVGRDVAALDESAVSRAAIESAAENFSDGVVAPVFWFLLAGLPGIVAYKLVNTADSMIGYRNEKYLEFGWAAARLDDVMNYFPARISAGLIAFATGSAEAIKVVRADARQHRSPNAGWPEAAMAGALGVALSGPRVYAGQLTDDSFVNKAGRTDLGAADIARAVRVLWQAWALMLAGLALGGVFYVW
jgi:adenosylcobinamide-phosphate synthase